MVKDADEMLKFERASSHTILTIALFVGQLRMPAVPRAYILTLFIFVIFFLCAFVMESDVQRQPLY